MNYSDQTSKKIGLLIYTLRTFSEACKTKTHDIQINVFLAIKKQAKRGSDKNYTHLFHVNFKGSSGLTFGAGARLHFLGL